MGVLEAQVPFNHCPDHVQHVARAVVLSMAQKRRRVRLRQLPVRQRFSNQLLPGHLLLTSFLENALQSFSPAGALYAINKKT